MVIKFYRCLDKWMSIAERSDISTTLMYFSCTVDRILMLKFGYIYYILSNSKLPRIRKALDLANHDSKVYIGE